MWLEIEMKSEFVFQISGPQGRSKTHHRLLGVTQKMEKCTTERKRYYSSTNKWNDTVSNFNDL